MKPLIDLENDQSFADSLRNSDHPVVVKPAELANRLADCRRSRKVNQVAMVIALPSALVLIGVAASWMMAGPEPVPDSGSLVQKTTVETETFEVEPEVSPFEVLAATLKNNELLAEKQTELREIQQEVSSLRKLKSQHERALSREFVSRTEIDQTISAYRF